MYSTAFTLGSDRVIRDRRASFYYVLGLSGGGARIAVFFFKQKTAYDVMPSLVGSGMCIRGRGDRAGSLVAAVPLIPARDAVRSSRL